MTTITIRNLAFGVCVVALMGFAAPSFATSDAAKTDTAKSEVKQGAAEGSGDAAAVTEAAAPQDNAMAPADNAPHEAAGAPAADAHHVPVPPQVDWSFNGATGTFDRPAMQRGFQIYKQVCAACHGLNRLAYRNLSALGYSEGEIKAFAAEATVSDGPNDEGEMFERPGRPADHFKAPFANEEAARYANNGALPPDLSLIVRARHDGANYVHGILTGFKEAPAGFTVNPGMHYNEYFAGHQIAMAPPLSDGVVTYDDGTASSVDQMASDVTTFLAWASDPTMEVRKQTGVKVMIFLLVFSVLMYLTKRKIWKDMH